MVQIAVRTGTLGTELDQASFVSADLVTSPVHRLCLQMNLLVQKRHIGEIKVRCTLDHHLQSHVVHQIQIKATGNFSPWGPAALRPHNSYICDAFPNVVKASIIDPAFWKQKPMLHGGRKPGTLDVATHVFWSFRGQPTLRLYPLDFPLDATLLRPHDPT